MVSKRSLAFQNRIEHYLDQTLQISQGARILLGISGGSDSVCLLHICVQFAKQRDWDLALAHVNHGLRENESDADEKWVRQLAQDYDLPCFVSYQNLKQELNKEGGNLEDKARVFRYQCYERVSKKWNASYVALGHHLYDQAETVLMHFLRGAKVKGLAGMSPKRLLRENVPVELIRPLLECSKEDIEIYIKEQCLSFREDQSNQDLRFLRNRVRHELIPLLEKTYQPRLIAQMGSFANYAEGLEEHLQNYFEDLCSDIVREDDNYLIIDLLAFERLSTFWKKECLYRLLKEVKTVGQELTRVHVNEVMKVLESTNPYVQMQVLKNLWFTKAYAQGAIGRKPLLEDMRLSFSC